MFMAGQKTDRLSTEEAKLRLHQTMSEVGLHALVKRRPYEAVAASFVVGLALAASKSARGAVLRLLLRLV